MDGWRIGVVIGIGVFQMIIKLNLIFLMMNKPQDSLLYLGRTILSGSKKSILLIMSAESMKDELGECP